ncbi:hypothetical protein HDU98_010394 [Podochytrium sp. JEL0797]|nr:hypothetical protein HDU98_010394 [Podochytrium sp. JEL0797]
MAAIVDIPANSDFPLENIPFGIISTAVDVTNAPCCHCDRRLRYVLILFTSLSHAQRVHAPGSPRLDNAALKDAALHPRETVRNHLPIQITDFYSSRVHAFIVGVMFKGKDNALQASSQNWVHIPVGYHGCASSVVVSRTPIRRSNGLIQDFVFKEVHFSQCKKLDYELETAFIIGIGNDFGAPIKIEDAEQHMFGMVLMNDWSARDIQAFEYVPLGPFLGKNFGTTISPWIVTMDALEPFRVAQPVQDRIPANDLRSPSKDGGADTSSLGSLLEGSLNGKQDIVLSEDGTVTLRFIEDGDSLTITGKCEAEVNGEKIRIGFGACGGSVLPAVKF